MNNIKDLMDAADLSRNGVLYRLKQMEESGVIIPEEYGKGGVRIFNDDFLCLFVEHKGKKPGRKRKDGN